MRLVAAILSSIVMATLAVAEPAKQAASKSANSAAAAKKQEAAAKTKQAEPKAKAGAAKAKDATAKDVKAKDTKAKKTKPNPLVDSYAAIPLNERLSIQSADGAAPCGCSSGPALRRRSPTGPRCSRRTTARCASTRASGAGEDAGPHRR